MSTNTFLGLSERLLTDPAAKAAYAADPQGFLEAEGFGALSPDEVSTGLRHVAQVLPPSVAEAVEPDAGLDGLAEVDLAALGVDGLDDFSTPLEVDDLEPAYGDGDDDLDDIDGLDVSAPTPPQTETGAVPTSATETQDDAATDGTADDIDADAATVVTAEAPRTDIDVPDGGGAPEPTFDDIDEPNFADIELDEPELDTDVPDDERWDLFDL